IAKLTRDPQEVALLRGETEQRPPPGGKPPAAGQRKGPSEATKNETDKMKSQLNGIDRQIATRQAELNRLRALEADYARRHLSGSFNDAIANEMLGIQMLEA